MGRSAGVKVGCRSGFEKSWTFAGAGEFPQVFRDRSNILFTLFAGYCAAGPDIYIVQMLSPILRVLKTACMVAVFVSVVMNSKGMVAESQKPQQTLPHLVGYYHSLADHPRVFTTQAELKDLAARINKPGSYSRQRFSQLAGQIQRDLSADLAWDATYSGCNIETYLYTFSYEPQDLAHGPTIRADLRLAASAKPPAGGAVVASRLALYAALIKAGAVAPANAPVPEQAAALAKRILLAWADHGFRDSNAHFLSMASQFCLSDGKVSPESMTQVGLQVARGVAYSAHAQDLLMYLGVFDLHEADRLNSFHAAMYELVRNALNYRFVDHPDWECNRYSNHVGAQLTGLLAVARLLDDKPRFEAVLYGGNSAISVALPWIDYFDKAIYGVGGRPNACYANTGPDGLTSRPFFQTADVMSGEIDDRYRNAYSLQGIGYAMATLEWLYDMADILQVAGFNSYGYLGQHGQSIEKATQFYACYANGAGFGKVVTRNNSGLCPNFEQYDGKVVNGAERNIVQGALMFKDDSEITELETAAKASASSGPLSLDSILFGRWRD